MISIGKRTIGSYLLFSHGYDMFDMSETVLYAVRYLNTKDRLKLDEQVFLNAWYKRLVLVGEFIAYA